ncbi:Uncharacterized protein PECH_007375 [Penicillium ucsense]|uniref:Amine oxidase domain-containing protein n=1 Tax=Penicillium ucsense TaxID=2839758 RepID=A0A8J8WII5_9EURO|nr:Uncharacterized protein PECM_003856 [Penicillium ucsense]KAF7734922.1 Uncharacterized protein PECH_007375 [Penicillium ucsense]
MFSISRFCLLWQICSATVTLPHSAKHQAAAAHAIVRDVAIIGGGATGTYAAIRLQEDFNKSVVVIEKERALGGHTHTYHDPISKTNVELGVVAFHDLPVVTKFFARFDIPLVKFFFNYTLKNVDFRNGHPVGELESVKSTLGMFADYSEQLQRFKSLEEGYVFPAPVPEDLVRPFEHFARIHNLTALIPRIWTIDQGVGDLLQLPTLYVLKSFGPQMLRSLSSGFWTTKRRNNHELYERAFQRLKTSNSVHVNSVVEFMNRDIPGRYGKMVVSTPFGNKVVHAKQFLFTIPPTLETLTGFDLDTYEKNLFSAFQYMEYSTGLIRGAPIARGTTMCNKIPNPHVYFLPRLPTVYTLGPTHQPSFLTDVKFGSNTSSMTEQQIREHILSDSSRALPGNPDLELVAYASHKPYQLRVSSDLIRDGFYQEMNGLQGLRRSYWTGAAWHAHDSGLLWNFTEGILLRMQQDWS